MNRGLPGFFGSRDFTTADSFFLWKSDHDIGAAGYATYYLLNSAPALPSVERWVKVGDANTFQAAMRIFFCGETAVCSSDRRTAWTATPLLCPGLLDASKFLKISHPQKTMTRIFAIIAPMLFLVSAMETKAQTLEWGSAVFSDLVDSHGEELDDSFVFELGTFDVGFTPTDSNYGDWFANWRVFDTASYSAANGYFTSTIDVQGVSDYDSLFEGMSAYIWVRNDSTPGTNTEWFLGRKSVGPEAWVFPDLDPDCCPTGEVTQWSITSLGGEPPVWGNQGGVLGGGDSSVGGPFDLQTHVVPEPGSALLFLLGSGLCLFRHRRAGVVFN